MDIFGLLANKNIKPNILDNMIVRKPVVQEDHFGCVIACMAYFLNCDYKEIRRAFESGEQMAKTQGFLCRDVAEILRRFGKRSYYCYLNKKSQTIVYKDGDIVFVVRSKKYPVGHYLIRSKDHWMDPWINFTRDKDIKNAQAGFRKRLPGRAIYLISSN